MRLTLLMLALSFSACAHAVWHKSARIPSPNGHYEVRLYKADGNSGNCPFDKCEVVRPEKSSVHYRYPVERLGGYPANAAIWSPDSSAVAIYSQTHRSGETLILRVTAAGISECRFPDIRLPHERNPQNEGRLAQSWVEPKQWLSNSDLLLSDSGVIQQQRGIDAQLTYNYSVLISFDKDGNGVVRTITPVEFKRDKSWNSQSKKHRI
jgi:hypothetical protein